ncbi:MAG: membrane protein insertase YidC [Actinomyces sp.]|nr:MAG: membrane protein insertase YidC [Actinomyces sp.]
MDKILWPLMVAVAWVMVYIHKFLVLIGIGKPDAPGVAWVLSIIGLTVFVRILIMPLFVKQIRASRGMQLMQPELQALQAKYKGKKDPASRQRQQEEMMALYRKHGTNPFSSCMPILIQMPIFFALFRVLANLGKVADSSGYGGHSAIGPLTADLAEQVQNSTVFGASLSSSFMNSSDLTVKIVTVIMIIAMSATQWYTMAQLSMKNMPESSKNSDNPMMRSQRMMMTVMPLFFAFTGVQFQIGVLIYWVTSNLWTMGQQFYTINRMPAPGSEAEKKFRARENAKRARKGLPSLEEEERAKAEAEGTAQAGGQRVQPVRKDRQKKGSGRATSGSGGKSESVSAVNEDDAVTGGSSSRRPGGLTDEEIARRRYEKRARERKRAAQRRKAQNRKRRS